MLPLTATKGLIFRITHIDNLSWMLRNGLCCRTSGRFDPNYRNIGNTELIAKRASRQVPIPPGGTLDDYVPFYFTSRSPMLYNIKTGMGVPAVPMREIIILVTSLPRLADQGVPFVYTDRHAYLVNAHFSSSLDDLDTRIDWDILRNSNFSYDHRDPGKMERYQAEALVYQSLDFEHLLGILAYDQVRKDSIEAKIGLAGYSTSVRIDGRYFF